MDYPYYGLWISVIAERPAAFLHRVDTDRAIDGSHAAQFQTLSPSRGLVRPISPSPIEHIHSHDVI